MSMQTRQFDSTLTGDPAASTDSQGSGRVASIALLVRNFRVAALVVTWLVALVLSHGYRWLADQQLVENGATANETMAGAILGAMRLEGAEAVSPAAGTPLRLQQEPMRGQFHTAVVALLRATVVRRVQVLTPSGTVAYSTEPTRRGTGESADATMRRASQGEPGSALSQDREFVGWDGVAFKGDILSTFVPVRDAQGRITAVIQIDRDFTPSLKRIRASQPWIFLFVALVLLALYLAVVAVMQRMVAVVERQQSALQVSHQRLATAKSMAEQASRAKSAFLANMSHEIRTPMNGVLGMAELLDLTPLNAMQKRYVKTLRQSGRSLMSLLNDILDLSKIEAGRIELERRTFDLRAAVHACVDLMAPSASIKGLKFVLDIPPDMPSWVQGDPMRLQQVLNNLIGNAIKFTDSGEIEVTVRATVGDHTNRYVVCVNDTGRGIDARLIDSLFEPFVQADSSTARKHGGSGLGLAIAKRLVEEMGGQLTLESTVGQGSRFCFSVELARTSQPDVDLRVSDSNFQALDELPALEPKLRVLLVEDNPVNQLYCQALLEQMGHQVELANDGLEAVELALAARHDIILMDCHLPALDGFEATRQIRQAERRSGERRRTIVALTASAMAEDHARCLDAGMDEMLSKPFTRAEMKALLQRLSVGVPSGMP